MENDKKCVELSDQELSEVTGGICSSDTYNELGVPFDKRFQQGTNHPVITTIRNSCWYVGPNKKCQDCGRYNKFNAISGYCGVRSKEYDIHKW